MFDFVRGLIAFRKAHRLLSLEQFYRPEEITWFNPEGHVPDWQDESSLGCHIHTGKESDAQMCLLFNPTIHAIDFPLPHLSEPLGWFKFLDTAAPAKLDITPPDQAVSLFGYVSLRVPAQSLLALIARPLKLNASV